MYLYYNTENRRFTIFKTKAEAGSKSPLYSSEEELMKCPARLQDYSVFYAETVRVDLRRFPDRKTAVRRCWAAAVAKARGDWLPNPNLDVLPVTPLQKEREEKRRQKYDRAVAEGDILGVRSAVQMKRGANSGKIVKPLCPDNPRKEGSFGHRSYAILLENPDGMPYEEYIKSGGRLQDLKWDMARGWASME